MRPDEVAVLAPSIIPAVFEHTEEKLQGALRFAFDKSKKHQPWRIRVAGNAFSGDVSDPVRLIDDTRAKLSQAPAIVVQTGDRERDTDTAAA